MFRLLEYRAEFEMLHLLLEVLIPNGGSQAMHSDSLSILAGLVSSTIFISSNLPMLFKAFKTKDLSSYSLGHLSLGTLGNLIYWLYVISLPFGPVWILQIFFTLASASMLFCYLRYEKNWFRF